MQAEKLRALGIEVEEIGKPFTATVEVRVCIPAHGRTSRSLRLFSASSQLALRFIAVCQHLLDAHTAPEYPDGHGNIHHLRGDVDHLSTGTTSVQIVLSSAIKLLSFLFWVL